MSTVFEKILEFFKNRQISYRHIHHQPTYTCEESAKARSESIEIGAKALLMKVDGIYSLFVLSASKQLESKKIKSFFIHPVIAFCKRRRIVGANIPSSWFCSPIWKTDTSFSALCRLFNRRTTTHCFQCRLTI